VTGEENPPVGRGPLVLGFEIGRDDFVDAMPRSSVEEVSLAMASLAVYK
jgi:hypothetical protein